MSNVPARAVEWRIFPTASSQPSSPHLPQCYHYDDGDEVFIRPKSNNQFGKYGRVVKKTQTTSCSGEVQQQSGQSNDNANSSDNQNGSKRRVTVELHSSRDNKALSYQATFRPNRLIRRYRPCYSDSSSGSCSTNNGNKIQILVTAKTIHYRILAASQLNTDDSILEIGCSNGQCSILILKYGGHFIGYDTSKKMIEDAVNNEMIKKLIADKNKRKISAEYSVDKKDLRNQNKDDSLIKKLNDDDNKNNRGNKNNNYNFYTIDPFQDPKKAVKVAMQSQNTNVVFIDIGGNREIESVLRMIQWSRELLLSSSKNVTHQQKDMLIVVKSEQLVERLEKETISSSSSKSKSDIHSIGPLPPKRKKINPNMPITIDLKTGLIQNCEEWFQAEQSLLEGDESPSKQCQDGASTAKMSTKPAGPPKYSHPLKAPMSLCPIDGKTPICRYYNYHKRGCRKGDNCEFDHTYCHWCKRKGHIALDCQKIVN